mmetsp:Transcript_7292/g.21412  ORF Transcript_7292/g.21412 Transcript_7292/m.21412 type:complete len:493 (+) Transcript_7292:657-2135(+)
MASQQGSDDAERHGDEHPQEEELEDRHERYRVDGSVHQGDAVEHSQDGDSDGWQQQDGESHGGLPEAVHRGRVLAAAGPSRHGGEVLLEELAGCVTGQDGREGVAEDDGLHHFAALFVHLAVDWAQDCKDNDAEGEDDQLPSGSDHGREERQQHGCAEDVAVNLLPSSVFDLLSGQAFLFGILVDEAILEVVHDAVSCVILLEGAEEDEGDQTHQEQDHHEGVEDGEPVDRVLEEVVVQVAIESGVECLVGRLEFDGEREGVCFAGLHGLQGVRIGREIHLDDLVLVVEDFQLSFGVNVRVDVGLGDDGIIQLGHVIKTCQVILVVDLGLLVGLDHLADHPPHRQVVQVHLVEPSVLDGVLELLCLLLAEGRRGAGLRLAAAVQEQDVVTGMPQCMPATQLLSHGVGLPLVESAGASVVLGVVLCVRRAVRQGVVLVGLLRIGVRSDLVHPELDMVALFVFVRVRIRAGCGCQRCCPNGSHCLRYPLHRWEL